MTYLSSNYIRVTPVTPICIYITLRIRNETAYCETGRRNASGQTFHSVRMGGTAIIPSFKIGGLLRSLEDDILDWIKGCQLKQETTIITSTGRKAQKKGG